MNNIFLKIEDILPKFQIYVFTLRYLCLKSKFKNKGFKFKSRVFLLNLIYLFSNKNVLKFKTKFLVVAFLSFSFDIYIHNFFFIINDNLSITKVFMNIYDFFNTKESFNLSTISIVLK